MMTAPASSARPGRARSALLARLSRVPLRNRLIVITVALLVLGQLLTVAATTFLLERNLRARLVDELDTSVGTVRDLVWRADGGAASTTALSDMPTSYYVVFWSTTSSAQRTIKATTEREIPDIERMTPTSPEVVSELPFEVPSIDGNQDWLVRAGATDDGHYTYAIAASERNIDRTVQNVMAFATLVGIGAALTCLIGGWFLINRAFRPLRRIEETASAIAAGDLTRRVPSRRSSDEIESLSSSLNVMLERIEESFGVVEHSEERMRQFVADASHELRTPLAAVRGYAELYRQGAVREPEQVGQVMARIEGEATRMSGLVEDLLALARLDEQRPMAFAETDLTVIVMDTAEDARAIAPDRRIKVMGLDGALGPTVLCGDDARLRQVVTNLVANALNHTTPGTPVDLVVGFRGDVARVEIRDHGAGIPADEAPHVFERFYRQDRSRTRGEAEQGGTGLGLAIVAAIVAGHRGTVAVETTDGGGATFVVELPRDVTAQS